MALSEKEKEIADALAGWTPALIQPRSTEAFVDGERGDCTFYIEEEIKILRYKIVVIDNLPASQQDEHASALAEETRRHLGAMSALLAMRKQESFDRLRKDIANGMATLPCEAPILRFLTDDERRLATATYDDPEKRALYLAWRERQKLS